MRAAISLSSGLQIKPQSPYAEFYQTGEIEIAGIAEGYSLEVKAYPLNSRWGLRLKPIATTENYRIMQFRAHNPRGIALAEYLFGKWHVKPKGREEKSAFRRVLRAVTDILERGAGRGRRHEQAQD